MSESPDGKAPEVTVPLDLSEVAALAARHGPLRLRIGGLPAAARLSAGDRQDDGTWLIGADHWSGLALIAPADLPDFDLEMLPEPEPDEPLPEATAELEPEPEPEPDRAPASPATAMVPAPEPEPTATSSSAWSRRLGPPGADRYRPPIPPRQSWVDAVDD